MKTIIYLMMLFLFNTAYSQPDKYEKQLMSEANPKTENFTLLQSLEGTLNPLVYASNFQSDMEKSNPTIKLDSIVSTANYVREFIYDDPCRLLQIIDRERYDGEYLKEKVVKRKEFEYDSRGLMSKISVYSPDEDEDYEAPNGLTLSEQTYLTYNDSSQMKELIWSAIFFDNQLDTIVKMTFFYDDKGKLEKADYYETIWANIMYEIQLSYDLNGNLSKYCVAYEGSPVVDIDYTWSAEGNMVKETYMIYPSLYTRSVHYTYDADGDLIHKQSFMFGSGGSEKYYYNDEVSADQIVSCSYPVLQGAYPVSYFNLIQNKSVKQLTGVSKVEDGEYLQYYYSDVVGFTSTHDLDNQISVKVYPNPASDYIKIKATNSIEPIHLKLVDLTGKTVLVKEVNKEEKVVVNNLPTGLYLFRIEQQNRTTTGKLILK